MPQNPRNAGRQPFCCIFHRSTRFWCQINLLLLYRNYPVCQAAIFPTAMESAGRWQDHPAPPGRRRRFQSGMPHCPSVGRQKPEPPEHRRRRTASDFFRRRFLLQKPGPTVTAAELFRMACLNNRAIRANGKQDRQTQSRSVFAATASGRKPPCVCSSPCVAVPSCALSNCEPSENDDRKRLTAGASCANIAGTSGSCKSRNRRISN